MRLLLPGKTDDAFEERVWFSPSVETPMSVFTEAHLVVTIPAWKIFQTPHRET